MLPKLEISLKQYTSGCQVLSSPLLEEALNLGLIIKSIKPSLIISSPLLFSQGESGVSKIKVRKPQGHRYFPDCLREQEARFIEWLLHRYNGNCWFFTQTFKDYVCTGRAERLQTRFLSRLNQAYKSVPGAELLRSISSSEWQQRDVIHFHLLIFGLGLGVLSRKRWEHRWQMISGGFAANYNAEVKAAPYLVKHQIKGRLDSSLHLGGSWRGINPPRSVNKCCSAALSLVSESRDSVSQAVCFKRHQGLLGSSLPYQLKQFPGEVAI